MDQTQPIIDIEPIVHTTTALDSGQTCLVDDPVHIVDDPNILVGSLTTPIGSLRAGIIVTPTQIDIPIRK